MNHLVLLLVLAAVAACAGKTPAQEACLENTGKQLTRAEWRACNGYQDRDAGPGGP